MPERHTHDARKIRGLVAQGVERRDSHRRRDGTAGRSPTRLRREGELRRRAGHHVERRTLGGGQTGRGGGQRDRKSTRLNSSHVRISYAVFCLKKKNKLQTRQRDWPAPGS